MAGRVAGRMAGRVAGRVEVHDLIILMHEY
jgi:hypothetical protein